MVYFAYYKMGGKRVWAEIISQQNVQKRIQILSLVHFQQFIWTMPMEMVLPNEEKINLNLNFQINYLKTSINRCLQSRASLPVQPGLMTPATLNPSTSAAHFMVT